MDPDVLRGVVFSQALFVFAMTVAIVIRYAMKMAVTPREDRAKPWHILLIGLSYLWAIVIICMVIRERWGTPLTYVAYNAAGVFILGDAALLFMLSHLFVQRRMINEIRAHVLQQAEDEKRELASELRKQTNGLARMITAAGEKADHAYDEATAINGKLTEIQTEAATARETAASVSEKADVIGETGKDTNERVRNIEKHKP